MSNQTFFEIEDIARVVNATVEDVRLVAMVELDNDDWDDDMERVTEEGRQLLIVHFNGGSDPLSDGTADSD